MPRKRIFCRGYQSPILLKCSREFFGNVLTVAITQADVDLDERQDYGEDRLIGIGLLRNLGLVSSPVSGWKEAGS